MKLLKTIETVNLDLLAKLLESDGYSSPSGRATIQFGVLIKWFPARKNGSITYGMILHNSQSEIGCRLSHLSRNESMGIENPKLKDQVFFIQTSAPKKNARPIALVWGLVTNLPDEVFIHEPSRSDSKKWFHRILPILRCRKPKKRPSL